VASVPAGSSPAERLVGWLALERRPTTDDRETPSPGWDAVLRAAEREHVAPLLFKRLREAGALERLPTAERKRLRMAYFTSGDRNARLFRQLGPVLERFLASGVRVVLLKGACLAEVVYGDVALRPMCDIDLLVPQSDLDRAEAMLFDMGAVLLKRPLPPAPGAEAETGCGKANHAPPVAIRELAIELHWTIISPAGPVKADVAGLWERARPATMAGVSVQSLSPDDLLLHLCVHLCYHHGCVGLRYLCDVAETVRRFSGELDWPGFARRAEEWGAATYAGLGLLLAREVLGADVPADVLGQLLPGGLDPRALAAARKSVVSGVAYDKWLSPAFLGLKQGRRETEGGRRKADKVGLWERVFLSRDALLTEYPAARVSRFPWLFHARRLWDITRKWAPALAKMPGRKWEQDLQGSAELDKWLKGSGKQTVDSRQ
jgi:hypothetical protein